MTAADQSSYPPPLYSDTSRTQADGLLIPDNVTALDPQWLAAMGWQDATDLDEPPEP